MDMHRPISGAIRLGNEAIHPMLLTYRRKSKATHLRIFYFRIYYFEIKRPHSLTHIYF